MERLPGRRKYLGTPRTPREQTELIDEFPKASPSKPDQGTLAEALREAAEKEAKRKARAEAVREAKELRKRKAEEALAGVSKRRSGRLQARGSRSGTAQAVST